MPTRPPPVKQLTTLKSERAWVAQLRRSMPKVPPAGWSTKGVVRVTPYDEAGVFGVYYTGKGMRLVATRQSNEGTQVTLSCEEGLPTKEMIRTAKEDFFPDQEVDHTTPLSGLVFLIPPE